MIKLGDLHISDFGQTGVFLCPEVMEDDHRTGNALDIALLSDSDHITGVSPTKGDTMLQYSAQYMEVQAIDLKEKPKVLKLDFRDLGKRNVPYKVILELLLDVDKSLEP